MHPRRQNAVSDYSSVINRMIKFIKSSYYIQFMTSLVRHYNTIHFNPLINNTKCIPVNSVSIKLCRKNRWTLVGLIETNKPRLPLV